MEVPSRACRALARHARTNAVAYVALSCSVGALAGASYASFSVPAASVGAPQIRNHVITPVKFATGSIGGVVRHWATVDATGHVVNASSRAHAQRGGNVVLIHWFDRFSPRCAAVSTVHAVGDVAVGSVEASVAANGRGPTRVIVTGSTAQGQPVAQPFYVAVVC